MGMIHRSVFIYHICGFSPKENYLLTKTYHYWTDWHIVKPRFFLFFNVTRCSNNNHGLNSEKDSSAGL